MDYVQLNLSSIIFFIFILMFKVTVPIASSPQDDPEIYKLSKLNINTRKITVSGFSAGASMTTQIHIAHSSLFSGAAIFSQAFYRCGPNSLIEFAIRCSKYGYEIIPYDLENSLKDARAYEKDGLIDPLKFLQSQKVFVWTGSLDEYIPEKMAVKNAELYRKFIPSAQVSLNVETAKHLLPTDNFGDGCDQNAEHNYYLGNCNYSGAYQALRFLLGDSIIQPSERIFHPSQLKVFDQSEFHIEGNITKAAMGNRGHIYIPRNCENGQVECLLHINFHGCNEWPLDLAWNYTTNSGYLPLAEANNIIILFPLTTAVPSNYNGCWDFFSYTGKYFATKQGEQIKVVYRMIQRMLGDQTNNELLIAK